MGEDGKKVKGLGRRNKGSKVMLRLPACLGIWKSRNELVFSRKRLNIDRVFAEIQAMSFLWFKNRLELHVSIHALNPRLTIPHGLKGCVWYVELFIKIEIFEKDLEFKLILMSKEILNFIIVAMVGVANAMMVSDWRFKFFLLNFLQFGRNVGELVLI
ncbi:hypothetical protein Hanom_Chr05g00428771 [Helianthus anomalus]